jgi:hypothetical protein
LEIFLALLWLIIAARLPDREPVRVYAEASAREASQGEERRKAKKSRRRLRKKLR